MRLDMVFRWYYNTMFTEAAALVAYNGSLWCVCGAIHMSLYGVW